MKSSVGLTLARAILIVSVKACLLRTFYFRDQGWDQTHIQRNKVSCFPKCDVKWSQLKSATASGASVRLERGLRVRTSVGSRWEVKVGVDTMKCSSSCPGESLKPGWEGFGNTWSIPPYTLFDVHKKIISNGGKDPANPNRTQVHCCSLSILLLRHWGLRHSTPFDSAMDLPDTPFSITDFWGQDSDK